MKDKPAFPITNDIALGIVVDREVSPEGMTLREYYAGLAMQGLLSDPDLGQGMKKGDFLKWLATYSVESADALIGELEEKK